MKRIFISIFAACIFFSSCTLKYDEGIDAESKNPEFIFYNTKMTRYENSKKTAEFTAENIEQYKNSDATYAKKIAFKTFDKQQDVETEGSCDYMYADTTKELYELYDSIRLFSKKNDINFYADILRWNAKTEQLTSGRTDMVRLEKDGTAIVGSGFSASGVSGTYAFTGSVSGNIVTKENNREENAK